MKSQSIFRVVIFLILGAVLLQQNAFAKDKGPLHWRVKDLASAPVDVLKLRDAREKVVGTVQTKQMLLVYSAMAGLVEKAEIYAELFVVEGKGPNAFATIAEDEEGNERNVVGFTFGMLEMIGMDVDAAAAIIGHELAHLKLKHIDERKDAIKKTGGSNTFSASSTKYTRDNERESDYLGAIWSVEAGYDPDGAVRVHEKLYKVSKRNVGFSGSHPSSIERITILKSLARRLSK